MRISSFHALALALGLSLASCSQQTPATPAAATPEPGLAPDGTASADLTGDEGGVAGPTQRKFHSPNLFVRHTVRHRRAVPR